MLKIELHALQAHLERLELGPAFIDHLGWRDPSDRDRAWQSISARGESLERRTVAERGEAVVLEVRAQDGAFPSEKGRAQVYRDLVRRYPESLVIFSDGRKTRSLWCWTRPLDKGEVPRTRVHLRGQPGRFLLETVTSLHFDLGSREHSRSAMLVDVAHQLREAMDPGRMRWRLADDLHQQYEGLLRQLSPMPGMHQYAWVLLNRLAFIAFLQEGGLLEGASGHPRDAPLEVRELKTLLLEGVVKRGKAHSAQARAMLEQLTQLGGSLFLPHELEEIHPRPHLSDEVFAALLRFMERYSWKLDSTEQGAKDTVTPALLAASLAQEPHQRSGNIVAPPELSRYLCERALQPLILEAVHRGGTPRFKSFESLLLDLDEEVCRRLLHDVLPGLRILDPACGSGQLLREALEVLAAVYLAAIHRIDEGQDRALLADVAQWRREPGGLGYSIRREILTQNLFGAELDGVAVVAARSFLLLELLSAAERQAPSAASPRLDSHIVLGNALIPAGLEEKAENPAWMRPAAWGLEARGRLSENGGVDAIVATPPWRTLEAHGRIPLHALFIEHTLQWLRPGGQAAVLMPGAFYSQDSSRGLRRMLLHEGALREVIGFSNEFKLFDHSPRSLKLCVLVFGKDAPSREFKVAFRIDPRRAPRAESLDTFLHDDSSRISLTLDLLGRLSPDSLAIPEFQDASDLAISEKLTRFPSLRANALSGELLRLRRGLRFELTAHVLHTAPDPRRLWICRGRNLLRYGLDMTSPSLWIDEREAVPSVLGVEEEGLHTYRLALRVIARSTDARTLTATILPPRVLCESSVLVEAQDSLQPSERLYLVALLNSFTADYLIRQRVAGVRISISALMHLPIPCHQPSSPRGRALLVRAARLICTTPAFDELARSVGLRGHQDGANESSDRLRLQAEIEGLVAHLYGLEEDEFAHILTAFPLVPAPHTTAARNAYRDVAHGVVE